jgi:hypothetical protein
MNSSILPRAALCAGIACLALGCALGTGSKTASPAQPTAATTTSSPALNTQAVGTAIVGPPAGLLAFGDSSVAGIPGSFCWQGTCADVANMPAKTSLPLVDAPGATLHFSVASGTFTGWTASYGADGSSIQKLDSGGSVEDPDANPSANPSPLTSAQFATPPAGDWIVQIFVRFADGDATYLWHVRVV